MTTTSVTGAGSYGNLLGNSTVSSSTAATAAGDAGSGSTGSTQDLAQIFLQLLVAQMNNQDPLNPVDNNQLTSQMAQISTVTGINTLNATVSGLVSQMQQSTALQLTGHSVMVSGNALNLASNTSATSGVSAVGGYNLSGAATQVTVTISDASGNTVRQLSYGAQSAGMQDFTWDGTTSTGATAPAGNYSFSVSASNGATAVPTTAYNIEAVIGVAPQPNGSVQIMLGNNKQVPYSQIAQII